MAKESNEMSDAIAAMKALYFLVIVLFTLFGDGWTVAILFTFGD